MNADCLIQLCFGDAGLHCCGKTLHRYAKANCAWLWHQTVPGSVTLSSQLSSAALGSLTCRRHCVSQATGFVTLQLGADQSDMMVKKHCQQAVFKCILLRHRHGQTKHGNKRGKKRGKKHGTCRISATSGPTRWMPSTLSVLASTTTLMKPLPSLSVNESLNALQVQDKQ